MRKLSDPPGPSESTGSLRLVVAESGMIVRSIISIPSGIRATGACTTRSTAFEIEAVPAFMIHRIDSGDSGLGD